MTDDLVYPLVHRVFCQCSANLGIVTPHWVSQSHRVHAPAHTHTCMHAHTAEVRHRPDLPLLVPGVNLVDILWQQEVKQSLNSLGHSIRYVTVRPNLPFYESKLNHLLWKNRISPSFPGNICTTVFMQFVCCTISLGDIYSYSKGLGWGLGLQ